MGLFDQFKQAMTGDNIRRGFEGAAQSMQDMAANPSHILKDPAAGNAYGQEARRLQKQGILGSGVIVSVTPTGEVAVAGGERAVGLRGGEDLVEGRGVGLDHAAAQLAHLVVVGGTAPHGEPAEHRLLHGHGLDEPGQGGAQVDQLPAHRQVRRRRLRGG